MAMPRPGGRVLKIAKHVVPFLKNQQRRKPKEQQEREDTPSMRVGEYRDYVDAE